MYNSKNSNYKVVKAPIAQRIEQKFPELCVGGSNPSRCILDNKKGAYKAPLCRFLRIQNCL